MVQLLMRLAGVFEQDHACQAVSQEIGFPPYSTNESNWFDGLPHETVIPNRPLDLDSIFW